MNKVGILAVNLENVHDHLPYKCGKGKDFSKNRMATQLFRCCYIEGYTNSQEQAPPLDIPKVVKEQGNRSHQNG